MLRTDSYLLRLAWMEYIDDRPSHNEDMPREPLIKVWRKHHQLILACWRGLMQSVLPHSSWSMLEVLLGKRDLMRQIWMEEGGWFLTKAGKRRRRWFKGLRKPNPKTLKEEIAQAIRYYRESLSDGQHTEAEAVVLASSGTVYSAADIGCAKTRAQALRRVRHTFPAKLSYNDDDKLPLWPRSLRVRTNALVRKGVLQRPPFSRRLR